MTMPLKDVPSILDRWQDGKCPYAHEHSIVCDEAETLLQKVKYYQDLAKSRGPEGYDDKYHRLHRRIVEGLSTTLEMEYLQTLPAKENHDRFTYTHPYLYTMVKTLASAVVRMVMDWEKEE